jgi:hypothetical protein
MCIPWYKTELTTVLWYIMIRPQYTIIQYHYAYHYGALMRMIWWVQIMWQWRCFSLISASLLCTDIIHDTNMRSINSIYFAPPPLQSGFPFRFSNPRHPSIDCVQLIVYLHFALKSALLLFQMIRIPIYYVNNFTIICHIMKVINNIF